MYIATNGHEANGAIIGMVLGDSSLQQSERAVNVMLITRHKAASRDYLEFKKEFLSPYFSGEIKSYVSVLGDKEFPGVSWRTPHEKRLRYHLQDFYPNGKKIAKTSVLNRLTSLGLALWYADDGCLHAGDKFKGITLYTNGFDDRSRQGIINWFDEMLGFKFSATVRGSIESDIQTAYRFLAIVKPYIDLVPSMRYKVDLSRILTPNSRAFPALPEGVKARLTGSDVSIPARGYVWQNWPKNWLWEPKLCEVCGDPIQTERPAIYCSNRCYQKHRRNQSPERVISLANLANSGNERIPS